MFKPLISLSILLMACLTPFSVAAQVQTENGTLTISPSGSVIVGTELVVTCQSPTPATVHLELTGTVNATESFDEYGGPQNVSFVKTEEWSTGGSTLTVTCAIREANESWIAAERITQYVQVLQPAITSSGQPSQKTVGVNFVGFCQDKYDYFGGNSKDAFSGRCGEDGVEVSINVYDVCQWQTDGDFPHPGLSDGYSLFNWSCNKLPAAVVSGNSLGVVACEGAPTSFMFDMAHGRSTLSGGMLNVRATPGGTIVEQLLNGETFTVTDGPNCTIPGAVHWKISNDRLEGWVKEGDEKGPYIEPWGIQP